MAQAIRRATAFDSEAILAIYAPYITDTAATFETSVPSVEEFAQRIEAIGARYPYLVYELDGEVAGYAYAARYKERSAYRFDVELSVYLAESGQGRGMAKKLYDRIFALLRAAGYCNAYVACTVPNDRSVLFHERYGFSLIGTFRKAGYKLGAWRDVAWFEKAVQAHRDEPAEPLSIEDLPEGFIAGVLALPEEQPA